MIWCMFGMYVLNVCFICMFYMYVLNVCFKCMFWMYVLMHVLMHVLMSVWNVSLKYVGPTANSQQGTSERGGDLMWY